MPAAATCSDCLPGYDGIRAAGRHYHPAPLICTLGETCGCGANNWAVLYGGMLPAMVVCQACRDRFNITERLRRCGRPAPARKGMTAGGAIAAFALAPVIPWDRLLLGLAVTVIVLGLPLAIGIEFLLWLRRRR